MKQIYETLCGICGEAHVLVREPMSRHTTFRTGGPADLLVQPKAEQIAPILEVCRNEEIPWTVIGNGSNLLVGDGGIRGVVLEIGKQMSDVVIEGTVITAGAGAMLSSIASRAAAAELTGMEFASGIPGSLGGAVVMNAGAYGGEMKDVVTSVKVMDADGHIYDMSSDELDFSYRHSAVEAEGLIVLEVTMKLAAGVQQDIDDRMKELSDSRRTKQPLEYPSAGSTFKRPEGYFAGKLIMDAGLRGYSVGGAQVSEKHCGFVVNRGGATAADVTGLIRDVQKKVMDQFGVMLEPEVKMLGDF